MVGGMSGKIYFARELLRVRMVWFECHIFLFKQQKIYLNKQENMTYVLQDLIREGPFFEVLKFNYPPPSMNMLSLYGPNHVQVNWD